METTNSDEKGFYIFRKLDADEEKQFRQHVRDNYDAMLMDAHLKPSPARPEDNEMYHPVTRDELKRVRVMRAYKKLAQDALDVQNACNSSGICHTLSAGFTTLWEVVDLKLDDAAIGTEWVNRHPIVQLFLCKLLDLAGGPTRFEAYLLCESIVNGGTAVPTTIPGVPTNREYYELTQNDVGRVLITAFGRTWRTANFIGRVLSTDVGKRVYKEGDILQVENNQQRSKRLVKEGV